MGLDAIIGKASESMGNAKSFDILLHKAAKYGINTNEFRTFDEDGNAIGYDYAKLSAAITEAKEKEAKTTTVDAKTDEFHRESKTKKESEIEVIQTQYAADKIDKEFKDVIKYANLMKKTVEPSQESNIAKQWDAMRAEAHKLTSVTADNTTVLEGVKEFIINIKELVADTKNAKADKDAKFEKETAISIKTARDIQDKRNKVQVYDTNFFNSVMKTIDERKAEEEAV